MKQVFVDSGGFFAHLAGTDAHHERAVALFQEAKAQGWLLITTNAVVFETYTLLLYRTRNGRAHALAFLESVEEGICTVERLTTADEAAAIALVRAHEDKTYSLCDAASFVVMERLGVTEAIAFDRHFSAYGRFTLL